MRIVDKERFIASVMVLLILVGLYIAIGTIERRQEKLEEQLLVFEYVEDKPPPIVELYREAETKRKTLCTCEMQSVYKSGSVIKMSLLPNKV